MKKIKTKLMLLSILSCAAHAVSAAAATASILLIAAKCGDKKNPALQKAAEAFKCIGVKKSA